MAWQADVAAAHTTLFARNPQGVTANQLVGFATWAARQGRPWATCIGCRQPVFGFHHRHEPVVAAPKAKA